MKPHPTFYVGRLKRYHDPQGPAAPPTPQAFREEEEDPTPRNETQPQTSSNVQRCKDETHAALVDREAAGTPEGSRTDQPQLGKPSTLHSHTAESTAERTRKSASPSAVPDHEGQPGPVEAGGSLIHIHIGRGRPATNPTMAFRDLPVQLVQAVLKLREDPAIPGLGGSITASPETQSDLEDKNALTETINLRVLRLSHSRRRCLVLEVERGLLHLSSTVMKRPTTTWSGSSASGLDGKRQPLVKWRGYPYSQNSWEPIERLQSDCPKAVAIWEQKRRQLRK
ncbi:hypothetical protein PC121_g19969 [Phytophthora cactorum]|nr:hypothetical protein PC120_g18829 [Phytophthora cactorum]KAG3047586.1 hypothetical protein PC121_g19969 [Phytophthora cactorum]KAG4039231.1 hypothetical protein PC123_g25218 [Phytophthora cactorum]